MPDKIFFDQFDGLSKAALKSLAEYEKQAAEMTRMEAELEITDDLSRARAFELVEQAADWNCAVDEWHDQWLRPSFDYVKAVGDAYRAYRGKLTDVCLLAGQKIKKFDGDRG